MTRHHPNHAVTVEKLSTELEAEPRPSLLGFQLVLDTGILEGRRRRGSVNEIVSIRTCIDDVACGCTTDDEGPFRIGPDCIVFETQRPARMIISVAEMPCVIFGGGNWFTTNSLPSMG